MLPNGVNLGTDTTTFMRAITKALLERSGLSGSVRHALYRETGYDYHRLKDFPAALLDADGYIAFASEKAFPPSLKFTKTHIYVPTGIKNIPGYARFKGNIKKRIRALLFAGQPTLHGAKRKPAVRLRGLDQGMERNLSRGAGFGDPETNRKIERAGINAARRYYRKLGWSVKSVERQKNKGYDLRCHKNDRELHVEVKGASGSKFAFTLTRREYVCASKDKQFELCFVASAQIRPAIQTMSDAKLLSHCDFWPLAYRVARSSVRRAGKP